MGQGWSVLIVEDEALIAMIAQETIEGLGHSVLGPAPSVQAAMQILRGAKPDLALLDIRLRQETSFPIADELNVAGVPFAFVTAQVDIPERFVSRPVLRKPYRLSELRGVIEALAREPIPPSS